MIRVFGIGPGREEWLPKIVHQDIADCTFLMGSERALRMFSELQAQKVLLSGKLRQTIEAIREAVASGEAVGVLLSGDPGFFSLLPTLRKEFPDQEIKVYPGISSLQLAFAKEGVAWQDAQVISVHGRSLNRLPLRWTNHLFILTGGDHSPQRVAQYYLDHGLNPQISVGDALSYPEEFWARLTAAELAQCTQVLSNAVLIVHPEKVRHNYPLGIPDDEFIRGQVPLTKAEVRVQVLAKAQIKPTDQVLDVGAGTGSLSIEAAHLASNGKVYAVEQNPEAIKLIEQNKQKFQAPNVQVVWGQAPEVLADIPEVDVCIIGGSKGQLKQILEQIPLASGGRVVVTAITLENTLTGLNTLKELGYQNVQAVSIQAVRWQEVGELHMASALNPVTIISAQKT